MFKFSSQSPSGKKIIITDSQALWSGERKIISKSMFGFEVEGEKKKILEADRDWGWRLEAETDGVGGGVGRSSGD